MVIEIEIGDRLTFENLATGQTITISLCGTAESGRQLVAINNAVGCKLQVYPAANQRGHAPQPHQLNPHRPSAHTRTTVQ